MGRRIALALVIVLVLFGGGYLVQRTLVGEPEVTEPVPQLPYVQPTKKEIDLRTRVVKVTGHVERRPWQGKEWIEIERGSILDNNDAIRTTEDAAAELEIGGAAIVEVDESSQFTVAEVSTTLSKVRLQGGRLKARVKGGGKVALRVEVEGSDAVAESTSGEFAILRTDDAQVTVATTTGQVDLQAHGQRVRVNAGEQSVVRKSAAPTKPAKIPSSLFLKISGARPNKLRTPETTIEGSTIPGAQVRINGTAASSDENGRFEANVPLREGKNAVVVTVKDAFGRTEQTSLKPIVVDTRPPKVSGEVVW